MTKLREPLTRSVISVAYDDDGMFQDPIFFSYCQERDDEAGIIRSGPRFVCHLRKKLNAWFSGSLGGRVCHCHEEASLWGFNHCPVRGMKRQWREELTGHEVGMAKMMKSPSTWEKERNGFSDLLLKSSFLIVEQIDREKGDL